jgi:hypothetical protein
MYATCTRDGPYLGCCEADQECTIIKRTCIGYEASVAGSCALPTDFHTVCCSTSLLPACHTYLFSTSASPGMTFTAFNCERAPGVDTLLDYAPQFTRSTTSTSSKSSSATSATTSSDGTASVTSTTPTQTSAPQDGGTNVGAIAGGTVGGLAAAGAIGLLIFFFILKGKKGKGSPATTMTQPHQASPGSGMAQTYSPVPGPTSPPAGYPYSPGGFQQPGWNPQGGAYDPPPQAQQNPYQSFQPNYNVAQQPPHPGAYAQQGLQNYPPQPPSNGPSPVSTQGPMYGGGDLSGMGGNKEGDFAGYYAPSHAVPASELDTGAAVGQPTNRAELT